MQQMHTINLRAKVHFHDVAIAQHGVIANIGGIVCSNVIQGAAGGKRDATLRAHKQNNAKIE